MKLIHQGNYWAIKEDDNGCLYFENRDGETESFESALADNTSPVPRNFIALAEKLIEGETL